MISERARSRRSRRPASRSRSWPGGAARAPSLLIGCAGEPGQQSQLSISAKGLSTAPSTRPSLIRQGAEARNWCTVRLGQRSGGRTDDSG